MELPIPYISVEEYLKIEETNLEKHEYFDGQMFSMAGTTANHSLLNVNIAILIGSFIKQNKLPCKVFSSDMRIKVEASTLYTYPDLSIACDEPKFENSKKNTLLNPSLVVEILSDSTEGYDRGKKFQFYRQIPSLKEYILIAQDYQQIEIFRKAENMWTFIDSFQSDTIKIQTLNMELSLKELYEVIF